MSLPTKTDVIKKYLETASRVDPIKCVGRISRVQGLLIESRGPQAVVGEICRIEAADGLIRAEVVGLRDDIVQLMAYEETGGLEIGARVTASGSRLEVPVSPRLLGRILGPFGEPVDGKGEIESPVLYPALANPPDPVKRRRITERISTGVRAIDGMLAVGRGQRLGIFSGSGVGKSTLLGMIARNTGADVSVVALIGERGRELNDFIADLGQEGFARTVIVVTPGNLPPLARLRGAYVATAVAEYFRDQGLDVMFLFDSVTRFARAQREIGLASGEPPATRGYTPSMFDSMPKLLERCGTSDRGTITGFYTVLVDGDDPDEPVSDTVRGILDGHIFLSRSLAESYHYPAIDVLKSISRLAPVVSGRESRKAEGRVRRLMADYAGIEDYISVGAYKAGSNPRVDEAIAKREVIEAFLIQDADEKSSLAETLTMMGEISGVKIPEEEAKAYSKEKDLPPPFPGKDDEIEDTAGEATGATDRINATDGIDAVDEIGDRIDAVNGIGTTDGIDATEAAERINTIDAVNGIGATEATDRIDATGATGDAIDTTGGIDATEAAERINTIDAVNGIGATEATDRIGDEEENRQIGEDAGIPAALAQEETEGAPEESAPDLPLMDF